MTLADGLIAWFALILVVNSVLLVRFHRVMNVTLYALHSFIETNRVFNDAIRDTQLKEAHNVHGHIEPDSTTTY